MILKLSICRVHMNLFYLLKTPIYADGVTNGAINLDTKEKTCLDHLAPKAYWAERTRQIRSSKK